MGKTPYFDLSNFFRPSRFRAKTADLLGLGKPPLCSGRLAGPRSILPSMGTVHCAVIHAGIT